MMLFARFVPVFLVLKVVLGFVLCLGCSVWQWIKARATKDLRSHRHPHGFTLIEIGVVLFIVCVLMGIAIPALSNLTGMKAKAEMNKLMSNIRATRGHAAVAGETCRMVFDLDKSAYSVECTKGQVTIGAEASQSPDAKKLRDDLKNKPDKDLTEAERMRRKILQRVQFAALPTLPTQTMKGGMSIDSVWTSHQEDKYTKGNAYLYFFPSGTTETANIVLHYGDDYYTVQVSPMTGKVKLLPNKVEKNTDSSDDSF